MKRKYKVISFEKYLRISEKKLANEKIILIKGSIIFLCLNNILFLILFSFLYFFLNKAKRNIFRELKEVLYAFKIE